MTFNRIEKEIFGFLDKQFPINATTIGMHDYDTMLDNCDADNLKSIFKTLKRFMHELDITEYEKKFELDRDILRNYLKNMVHEYEELSLYTRKPSLYPQFAIYSIYFLILNSPKMSSHTIDCIIRRLEKIPTLLEQGKVNIRSARTIPKLWLEFAHEITEKALIFFKNLHIKLDSKETKSFLKAKKQVLEALESYAHFLKQDIEKKPDGKFLVGKDYFEYLIEAKHGLKLSARELIEYGEEKVNKILQEIRMHAHHINSHDDWKTTITKLKKEHPTKNKLISTYKNEMKKARRFIEEQKIATIPHNELLKIIETPDFEKSTIPFAAYQPPEVFAKKPLGYFWVTPLDSKLSKDEQEKILMDHSYYSIPITAVHEAYPGHHLQLSKAFNLASITRRRMESSLFSEGWALYSEELMYELGYYEDPKIRLLQMKAMLWRATRIIIDAKLHTGKMTFNEAVNMLVEIPLLERLNAISEVTRYTFNPTQPMSYIMGMEEIFKLRKQYTKLHHKNFRLKDFHDTLLGYGSISINFIRKDLGL